jgi:type VII secretion-associated serine protease mycosin
VVTALLLAASAVPVLAVPGHADQVRDAQWHVDQLDLAGAHQITRGEGVTVALIDSGVDATHPDLRGNLLPGVDLVDPDNPNAWTPDQHGTLVAGVLAGHGHGPAAGDGVLGVAPGASVLPIRASSGDDDETPTSHLVADGIGYAVANGASVISISLSSEHSEMDELAIEAARRSDVVVVAAAGNRPDAEAVTFPAALPTVVAVGGTDRDGGPADFSVTGPEITLTAPGEEIVTTRPGGGYAVASGTSFAAPIVAGAAALVRSRYPDLTADEVIHRLVSTAADAGPPGHDEQHGHGVVDIVAALTAEEPPMPPVADEPDQIRLAQWHLDTLVLAAAHEVTRGDGVTVGLVGSGVDADHPDLHRNLLPGADLAEPDNQDAWTPAAGATALAGIIAGHGNRLTDHEPGNRGVLGIAPEAEILPVRVTGPDLTDRESVELAAEGIGWAAANRARVICYAAGLASQDLFAEAIDAARAADVVLVAAAGDRPGGSEIWFPAANPAVVAVAGVDRDGELSGASIPGPEVALAAPAVDLPAPAPGGGYTDHTGTGAAAAIVAGAAALVRAEFPELSADEVVHRLIATAQDQGPPGRDDQYGHGTLDLVAALTAEVPPLEPTPPAGGGPAPPIGTPLAMVAAVVSAVALGAVVTGGAYLLMARRRRSPSAPPASGPPAAEPPTSA